MNTSFATTAVIAVFSAFVTILGFMGKSFAIKGLKQCSKEQIAKFSRFSAWGYLILTICSGISAYLQYTNEDNGMKNDIPFFIAIVICFIIVMIAQKKYLKK